jgi:hypothetical protein
MTVATHILIMVLKLGAYASLSSLTVEFNSLAACEHARASIAKMHHVKHFYVVSQGCYKK